MECYMRDSCTRMICPGCSIYYDLLEQEKEKRENAGYLARSILRDYMAVVSSPGYWFHTTKIKDD